MFAEEAIGQLLVLEAAVRAQILKLIPSLDSNDEPWRADGATSLPAWLATRFGLADGTARELVDVARRLASLPAVAAVFAEGRLSWDQLRCAVRIATPATDEQWATDAAGFAPTQLQRLARARERITREQVAERHARRSVRWWHDHRHGLLRLTGAVPAADGEVVTTALSRLAEQAPENPDTGMYDAFETRCADALVDMCSARLAADADADRATVVIHVRAESLVDGDDSDTGELESGLPVSIDTVRRRCCDGRYQHLKVDAADRPLGIGRVAQTVPPWLRRLVRRRDRGCRFPGCGRTRLTHAHHLEWWSDGGPTDLDNLALLCTYHHKLVHEGGWAIFGHPDARLIFVRPDGRQLATGPPPDIDPGIFTRIEALTRFAISRGRADAVVRSPRARVGADDRRCARPQSPWRVVAGGPRVGRRQRRP